MTWHRISRHHSLAFRLSILVSVIWILDMLHMITIICDIDRLTFKFSVSFSVFNPGIGWYLSSGHVSNVTHMTCRSLTFGFQKFSPDIWTCHITHMISTSWHSRNSNPLPRTPWHESDIGFGIQILLISRRTRFRFSALVSVIWTPHIWYRCHDTWL